MRILQSATCFAAALIPVGLLPAQTVWPTTTADDILWWTRKDADRRRLLEFQRYTFPYNTLPRNRPTPWQVSYERGLREMFPRYEGLPTYPENVPGYGAYPGVRPTDPIRRAPPLKPLEPRTDRWPSWIGEDLVRSVKATASQAVLVQTAARVWVLGPGDDTYLPLRFFDKWRFLETGSRLQVRSRGEFTVYCHDAANIRSRGATDLQFLTLNPDVVDLKLNAVMRMWLRAASRPVRIRLTDDTVLKLQDTLVSFKNVGDYVMVFNSGPSVVSFEGKMGKGQIKKSENIRVWLQPSKKTHLSAGLELQGDVSSAEEGNQLKVTGGNRGTVTFSGARFAVPRGAKMVLTPLNANRFPQKGVGLEK